jgi:hypothetical protein
MILPETFQAGDASRVIPRSFPLSSNSKKTGKEKKDFADLFVEKVEVDPRKRKAVVRIRQFPAPAALDTGKLSIDVVAGARCEHQKTPFPPVDVVEVALIPRGSTFIPLAAA